MAKGSAKDPVNKYHAPALEKGLDILELLAEHSVGLSQAAIAKSLGRTANQNYRMLATLERRGYLIRSNCGELYQLSMQLYTLAHRHPPMRRLLSHVMPVLREAAEKAQQSIQIIVNNRGELLVPEVAESPGNFGLTFRRGSRCGLYNSAAGGVLSAFASEADLAELIATHRLIEGETVTPRAEFEKTMTKVRAQGFHRLPSSTIFGVENIAYPIFGPNNEAIAALACPYLSRIDKTNYASPQNVQTILADAALSLSMAGGSPSIEES